MSFVSISFNDFKALKIIIFFTYLPLYFLSYFNNSFINAKLLCFNYFHSLELLYQNQNWNTRHIVYEFCRVIILNRYQDKLGHFLNSPLFHTALLMTHIIFYRIKNKVRGITSNKKLDKNFDTLAIGDD